MGMLRDIFDAPVRHGSIVGDSLIAGGGRTRYAEAATEEAPATAGALPPDHPTRSREFKAWFGDWESDPARASRVVHPQGHPRENYGPVAPRPVYHGTARGGFDRFDPAKADPEALFGPGHYFTEDRSVADSYRRKAGEPSRHPDEAGGGTPETKEVYLNIRNPLDLSRPYSADEVARHLERVDPRWVDDNSHRIVGHENGEALYEQMAALEAGIDPFDPNHDAFDDVDHATAKARINNRLRRWGYDGITHIGGAHAGAGVGPRHRVWVAFHPHQIKSTSNRGTFDPGDERIDYAEDDVPDTAEPRPKPTPAGLGGSPMASGDSGEVYPVLAHIRERLGNPSVTHDDLAALSGGTLAGHRITLHLDGGWPNKKEPQPTRVDVSADAHDGTHGMDRSLMFDPSGDHHVVNHSFSVDPEHQGKGIGLDAFSLQVEAAHRLGLKRIETFGARGSRDTANGYYTWPRFGYDAEIKPLDRERLPDDLAHAGRVSDLMATTRGRSWWRTHGWGHDMEFDLSPGSHSLRVLNAYREAKGLPPIGVEKKRYAEDARHHEHAPHNETIGGKTYKGGEFTPKGGSAPDSGGPGKGPGTPQDATTDPDGRLFDQDDGKLPGRALALLAASCGDEALGPEDLASLTGAPDPEPVEVRHIWNVGFDHRIVKLGVIAKDGSYKMDRAVHLVEGGRSYVHNESFEVDPKHQGRGIGLDAFSRQVAQAVRLGFARITCVAGKSKTMNGYAVWPKFGYDTDLDPATIRTLPRALSGARRVSDLMKSKEGRAWWRKHGDATEMEFDLAEGSTSRRVLDAYRAEKNLPPIAAARASSSATSKTATKKSSTGSGTGSPARTPAGATRTRNSRSPADSPHPISAIGHRSNTIRYGTDPGRTESRAAAASRAASAVAAPGRQRDIPTPGPRRPQAADPRPSSSPVLYDDAAPAATSRALEPHPEVKRIADAYNAQAGLPEHGPMDYRPVDEGRAMRIADAYAAMPHAPSDPKVRASYDALKRETVAQYDHLLKSGVRLEPWSGEGQPYRDSREMRADATGGHLYYYPTEAGYGESGVGGDASDHPMLEPTGRTHGGKPVLVKDAFRAVHDYFGHALYGNQFGPRGEEHAWRAHRRMFSPEAIPAMTAEARGQNSFVNYGPHMRDREGRLIRPGQPGHLGVLDRPYADQKAGLLPEEFTVGDATRRYAATGGAPDPSIRIRMSRGGPRISIVRYEVRHAPKGGLVIAGTHYPGGEFIPTGALAQATPQQLAMIGMTRQQAQAAVASEGGTMSQNLVGPGGKQGRTFVATLDMLPEDMHDKVHIETLQALTSQEGVDEFVNLYEQTKSQCGGRIPSQAALEALAISGESVRGHYQEFLHDLVPIFGADGAKIWAIANSILSGRSNWLAHTLGAFRLVGEWIARKRPKDEASLNALIEDWFNIRKHGTDPEIGPRAYQMLDKHKKAKLVSLLSNPEGFSLDGMAKEHWAKTTEFAGSFLDGSRVAIDTHMAKLVGMDDAAEDVEAKKEWVTSNPARYGAYKASVMATAQKLGWKPSEVQEAVWGAVLGIGVMKRHGASADEMDRFLTHGTMSQTWDMHSLMSSPEMANVFEKLGIERPAVEDLGRKGPSQGGLEARGLAADRPVRTPDKAAFRRAVDAIPRADSGAGQGVKPVLPPGASPAGWSLDEPYTRLPTEAPDEKTFAATLASRERLAKKKAEKKPAAKTKKKASRELTVGDMLRRYIRQERSRLG